jgi:hypothetical protein
VPRDRAREVAKSVRLVLSILAHGRAIQTPSSPVDAGVVVAVERLAAPGVVEHIFPPVSGASACPREERDVGKGVAPATWFERPVRQGAARRTRRDPR